MGSRGEGEKSQTSRGDVVWGDHVVSPGGTGYIGRASDVVRVHWSFAIALDADTGEVDRNPGVIQD